MSTPLPTLVRMVEHLMGTAATADEIIADLVKDEAAKTGFSSGTHFLNLGKVRSTCTAGNSGLLDNWLTAARRKIASQRKAHQKQDKEPSA